MKLAVCLEFFWPELSLEARPARARAAGFEYGEIWGWRGRDLRALRDRAADQGFQIVSLSAMDPVPGFNDRGMHPRLQYEVRAAMDAAETLGCKQLIVMGGAAVTGVPFRAQLDAIAGGLRPLAREAQRRGMFLALEALNSRISYPGYFLDGSERQFAVVKKVGHAGLRAVYDLFHAGVMEGDHTRTLLAHLPHVASLQLAGVPHRNEPYLGEIHAPAILRALDDAGFEGWLTLEYKPSIDSDESLARSLAWLRGGTAA